jgi:hypothetical protein
MPIDKATANGYMLDATNRVWAKWGNVIPSYYRVPPAGLVTGTDREPAVFHDGKSGTVEGGAICHS